MSLAPGVRLGPYEVLSSLGAGGMGEVFRARDTILGRDIALKILPADVAHDAERIARFRREAQMLAAVNHPLIAAIYGVDDSGAAPVLVLELVEGITLAERISAGPLPLDESLAIAQQLTQALDAAHQAGIVHRDLKPANIKLRPDGTVKVLDFGLARGLAPSPNTARSATHATVTSPAVTAFGVILGTAAYMSPEQACGQPVDRGADVWAFGAVLFEMLTGSRAFEGADPTQTIASVLRTEPDWSRLPQGTPESVRRLLRRTLEKDRRRRLADIRDASLEIEDAQRSGLAPVPAVAAPRRERLLWIAAVGVLAIVAAVLALTGTTSQQTRPERRVEIVTPPTTDPVSLAISPDGRHLAFVAVSQGRTELWVRNLETGIAQPLRDTNGASSPFWSPDSRAIGFFAAERLRRVRLDGSATKVLGPGIIGTGGTWSPAGTILFPIVPDSTLLQLPEDGGQPTPVNMASLAQPGGHRFPHFLPDGRHFLFFIAEARAAFLGSTDGAAPRRLFDADAAAVFAPPSEVLFVRGGVLHSQPFDTARLSVEGDPVPLASGVAIGPLGGAALSASDEGTIAYRLGSGAQERQLVWFKRSGARDGVVGKPDTALPLNPTLSPDGRQVVFTRSLDGNTDLWIADVERGIPSPLTRQPMPDVAPTWLPDGRSIAYSAAVKPGTFEVRTKTVALDAEGTPLQGQQTISGFPMHYSDDGRYLLYRASGAILNWDIWAAPTFGDRKPFPVVNTQYDDRSAQFSPDSRLIAYESNQTGQFEIYVRPFRASGASRPVSNGGGSQPRWRRKVEGGELELYYVSPDSRLMCVSIKVPPEGQEVVIGQPRELFAVPVRAAVFGGTVSEYDVTADGQRFLVNTFVEKPTAPISLILDRRVRAR